MAVFLGIVAMVVLRGMIWRGVIGEKLEEKGYSEKREAWEWYGFFGGLIVYLIVISWPDTIDPAFVEKKEAPEKKSVPAGRTAVVVGKKESLAPEQWRCTCGRANPSYTSTCSCGVNRREIQMREIAQQELADREGPAVPEVQPEPVAAQPEPEIILQPEEQKPSAKALPVAYEGDAPYIFVSYAHLDTEEVFDVIRVLEHEGFRVWFDGGIEAGSEWPEYIASHLEACACVFCFISENFVKSPNCRRELNYAQSLDKPILSIYMDDVQMSAGMKMQLGLAQAILKKNFNTREEFCASICRAKLIAMCK